jgi:hypothetical protein
VCLLPRLSTHSLFGANLCFSHPPVVSHPLSLASFTGYDGGKLQQKSQLFLLCLPSSTAMSSSAMAGDYRFPPLRSSAHPYGASRVRVRPNLQNHKYGGSEQLASGDSTLQTSSRRGTESPSSPTQFSFANRPPPRSSLGTRLHSLDYTQHQTNSSAPYACGPDPAPLSRPFVSPTRSSTGKAIQTQQQHRPSSIVSRATELQTSTEPSWQSFGGMSALGSGLDAEEDRREGSKMRRSGPIPVPNVLLPKHK